MRDDQPRSVSCYQLALAIRAEVLDLEQAGIRVIQIDEATLREACHCANRNGPTTCTGRWNRSASPPMACMELLDAFDDFNYPNQIGPGMYDIHSPNIPGEAQMVELMRKAAERIPAQRL